MTTNATMLLETFDELSHAEQLAVATAIVSRLRQSAGTLDDETLIAVADELFVALDREEDCEDESTTR